jgi:hypothetical protein
MYNRTGIITPIPGSIGITVISHGISPPYRAVPIGIVAIIAVIPTDWLQRPVIVAQRQGRPHIDSCMGRMNMRMG